MQCYGWRLKRNTGVPVTIVVWANNWVEIPQGRAPLVWSREDLTTLDEALDLASDYTDRWAKKGYHLAVDCVQFDVPDEAMKHLLAGPRSPSDLQPVNAGAAVVKLLEEAAKSH